MNIPTKFFAHSYSYRVLEQIQLGCQGHLPIMAKIFFAIEQAVIKIKQNGSCIIWDN